MAQEIVQVQEKNPVIERPNIASGARGKHNIAQTLGNIADRSMVKSQDYAAEASKVNLLQTHSMLQDVEAQSKIEMLKSPGNSEAIARNADNTINKLKAGAKLNREDRRNFDSMAHTATTSLTLSAAEKSIALSRQQAKYATLSAFGDTLQSIRREIFTNPEQANTLIEAQYDAIAGQVRSGVITAVEGANLHKQLESQLIIAQDFVAALRNGTLDAADANAAHATEPGNVPMSNAHLPIDNHTAMVSNHYFGSLNETDIEAKFAGGERVTPMHLAGIKKLSTLDKILNYGAGAARATGDINAGTSWVELKHKLEVLKQTQQLSTQQKGYKARLNNFFLQAEQPGAYQNFIAGMPEGARAHQDYMDTEATINKEVIFGDDEATARMRSTKHLDNLNELISKSNTIGIGMQYPDHLRQPIPLQMIQPIADGFERDGNVMAAISNIQALSPKNRAYAMNAFPHNLRKQLTVYEVGNLVDSKDTLFLSTLMRSQQVEALGDKPGQKDAQVKFQQLAKDAAGYSDEKLKNYIMPQIPEITSYLSKQPRGGDLVAAKADQFLRYMKQSAVDNNDFTYVHKDTYIQEFKRNMTKAYQPSFGSNFVMDSVNVPLEENQKSILASQGIYEARLKLLEYKSHAEVDDIFDTNPPMMVSSPGGRVMVVYANGDFVPDKHGQPAYSELYTEHLWQHAEHEMNAIDTEKRIIHPVFGKPFLVNKRDFLQHVRGSTKIIKPVVEGNIDLENRPKIWDKEGNYQTVKTITREFDGKTVLLPTIINGKEVNVREATEHYKKTGEHMGIFNTREEADKYDEQLHRRMGWIGKNNKWRRE